jgi:hypothetical protein
MTMGTGRRLLGTNGMATIKASSRIAWIVTPAYQLPDFIR